eukprot:SAG11_NODE_2897_length_2853_cov_2.156500_2_plen_145_part_00
MSTNQKLRKCRRVQYHMTFTVRKRRAAEKYQPKMMDDDCVLAVPGDIITAAGTSTLLPAELHSRCTKKLIARCKLQISAESSEQSMNHFPYYAQRSTVCLGLSIFLLLHYCRRVQHDERMTESGLRKKIGKIFCAFFYLLVQDR